MLDISNFFNKIKERYGKEIFLRDTIVAAIKETIGIELDPMKITIKNGVIYIADANSALKNELFLKKGKIINKLNINNPKSIIVDIR